MAITDTEAVIKAIAAQGRLLVHAGAKDRVNVVCNIEPRRETMHVNKEGLSVMNEEGLLITIPFNARVLLPAIKFNELCGKRDMLVDLNVNPFTYKVVPFNYFIKEGLEDGGKECNTYGELLESVKAQEVTHYCEEGTDGAWRVFKKTNPTNVLRRFDSEQEATDYISSLSM